LSRDLSNARLLKIVRKKIQSSDTAHISQNQRVKKSNPQ